MVNTTAMEEMTKYYWGMLGARAAAAAGTTTATSDLRSSWPPPAHGGGGGEPSWEELAFARDAAGHLGGCVWPPRSYTCSFCRREFRSAQALGGHMNVHRRDRARLRLCASPDHDVVEVQDTQQIQPIVTPPVDHHHRHQDKQEARVFRAKEVLLSTNPNSTWDHQSYHSKEEGVISTSPSSLSTNIKEDKKKVVISIPAAAARRKEALHSYEEEDTMAAMRKRRRVDQPPEVVLPFFLRLPAASCERVHEHDAKVPKVITGPSSSRSHLADRQELDLELRLGSPEVM